MALYPIIEFDYPSSNARYDLPSGNLGVIKLDLQAGQKITLVMGMLIYDNMKLPEDLALRAWISKTQAGSPFVEQHSLTFWQLSTLLRDVVVLHADDVTVTDDRAMSAEPGIYWLNILNMVNATNTFTVNLIVE
jgi:hypothetical protein